MKTKRFSPPCSDLDIATYALGLTEAPERRAEIQARLAQDDAAAARALKWEAYFLSIADALPPSPPPPDLFSHICATLGMAPPDLRPDGRSGGAKGPHDGPTGVPVSSVNGDSRPGRAADATRPMDPPATGGRRPSLRSVAGVWCRTCRLWLARLSWKAIAGIIAAAVLVIAAAAVLIIANHHQAPKRNVHQAVILGR